MIYKTVINFFNKKITNLGVENIKKAVYRFYMLIIKHIGQVEVYNNIVCYVLDKLQDLSQNDKLHFELSLYQIKNWQQYISIIMLNIDSFINVNLALELLIYASENVNYKISNDVFMILNAFLHIYDAIKLEFALKLMKWFVLHLKRNFNILLDKLSDESEHEDILKFYNDCTEKLEKFILTTQRLVILNNESGKKNKKNRNKKSSNEVLFIAFVNVIYKIEDNLRTRYGEKVLKIKQRSFKLKEYK